MPGSRTALARRAAAAVAQLCAAGGGGKREAADLLERGDPVLERRVGVEHAAQARAQALVVAQRRLDVEVRGRPGDVLQRRVVVAQRGQRQGQPLGVAGELDRGGVGQVLALARERHLQHRRADRRQHRRDEPITTPNTPEAALLGVQPPKIVIRISMSAASAIAPTSTAAMLISRTSRLRMCPTSCASTPSSSRSSISCRRPVVTAT